MKFEHPTGTAPKRVAVVALGPSRDSFVASLLAHQQPVKWDEVWTLNTGLRCFPHNLCFIMDDMRYMAQRYPEYGKLMREHSRPIITSALYPEFPTAVAYPLDEVVKDVGKDHAYFHHNSIPYILAYAAALHSVEELWLFGADYSYPTHGKREKGREVAAHWIGFLAGRGTRVILAPDTTLLQRLERNEDDQWRNFYGYLAEPFFSPDG